MNEYSNIVEFQDKIIKSLLKAVMRPSVAKRIHFKPLRIATIHEYDAYIKDIDDTMEKTLVDIRMLNEEWKTIEFGKRPYSTGKQ